MVKAKRSKKVSADLVYAKKANAAGNSNPFAAASAAGSKKMNPFEVHINKAKFQILGRTCKHDKGLPGVSRNKAVKKRKETLALEFRDKDKTNRFKDRRIGRHLDASQLNEEVMNARFMAEKMSQLKQGKASRFNLNDDEILTHRGQTLEEIEQFRDERSDEEDMDEEGLNADFTEAAHFGGDDAQGKDRKTAIEEMIVEQKRRKIEIAKEKDEIHDLTEKLDTNYKNLVGLMGKITKSEMKAKQAPDDYDKAMREMIFEPRGAVTDKLLTEEEVAQKEKERLENLENQRLRRMQAEGEDIGEKEQPKHRSADDLDDGYFAYGEEEEVEGTLAYNLDGQLGTKITGNDEEKEQSDDENINEESSDNESSNDEEKGSVEEEDISDAEGAESENSNSEEDDNMSDLKESDSEAESEKEDKENKSKKLEKKQAKKNSKAAVDGTKTKERTDLPFTIEMPDSYEDFTDLLAKHTAEDKALIVERLIKCNHPKLEGVNREKVVKLFAFLMQYINELFSDATQIDVAAHFKVLDRLNPHLYDLVHLNPEKMSVILLGVIKEKYAEFRNNPKMFPPLETVVFFKLVSNYYSTSDFRHPIVTPCYIFIQHILSKARVRTRQDIAMGLFLATLSLEFSRQSKRFLPAALNYLLGIVYLSIPKRPIEVIKIMPPFQSTGPMNKLLALAEIPNKENIAEELLNSEDLVMTTFSTEFKIKALNMTLKLIGDAITIVSDNVGANYLAEPFLEMFERLSLDIYPEFVQNNFEATKKVLETVASKSLTKLVPPERKPKALRLLEPRFEAVYDDKRRPKLSKAKEEKVKLLHKLKRETKGAVREIRRDTEFLQKMRIQQQIQSDTERKEKVKRIYQEASVQQSELNELARLKKKKKF